MKIRFQNARILSMKEGEDIFFGELHVTDNKISYIGEEKPEFSKESWDRVIDARGNVLMPGFKNAHTHSAMTFLRTYAEDLPLKEWLNEKVFPMEAKLKPEDMYPLSILAIMEYLTSGITANFDMYMSPEFVAKASKDTGFRTVLCGSANNFGGTKESLRKEYETLNKYHELVSYQLGFHAEYTTSKELMLDIADLAKELKTPVYVHNSETKEEVAGCVERYGKTPTAFLDSIGMFEYGGGGFHCVHMTEEDLNICKEKGLYVVSNPGSNCKLASGIAPVSKMLEMGIPVALGTDGPASNNCLDMFKEMFLVSGLQKIACEDATAVDSMEVLKMATVNGAKAMGLTDCDVLSEGKLADLIMIDLNQPNMQPIHHIPKNIVYSGSKLNVAMTMVNGSILYEKGEFFIGVKPEDIYEQANGIIARIRETE
ncbi:MAG: amidohydrolase [Roseburia sp.]|nr:amidohydrolase [Roseburia sp.]MCM1279191.1 amidohydrolase [Robinsoniella sp.]